MKWVIVLAFYFLYWGICFLGTGTDKKNLVGLRSYPEFVQSIVRRRMTENAPKTKHIGSFLRGIPLFAVVAALSAWIVETI